MSTFQCPICFDSSTEVGVADCGHSYCSKCIRHWCEESSTCPICRQEIKKIRIFVNSFYMGQVINVEEKKVKVPDEQITLDDFIDDSEDFLSQYEEDSEPDPRNEGTTWISGHRISLRPQHRSQNKELFSQVFRSMVAEAKSKQEKSHLLRSLHACLEELQQQKKIDQIMFKQIRNKVISKFINNSELHAKFEDIKKYVMMQVVSMNPKLLSTKLTRKANSQLEKTEIEIE